MNNHALIALLTSRAQEAQADLCFLQHAKKISSSSYEELPITNASSVFIQKSIEGFDAVKFNLEQTVRHLKPEDVPTTALPNLFICKDKESAQRLEAALNGEKKDDADAAPTFRPQEPRHSLDRVILPPEVKEDIRVSLSLIAHQKRIYDDWGFAEVDDRPKLILNFYGPPGTGKTMVSHAVARELGKKILAVNYAEVESKYVGDAPKNLLKAFEAATRERAVLFFDEADSFLGKRITDVHNSSDQAINSLRSQMLILLEDFDGVVIFATNLAKNYDKAFDSRILKHIYFELPNRENREQIISLMIPSKVPLAADIDRKALCAQLAEISEGFSGREIKNAILESLSLAVRKGDETIGTDAFVRGFELIKEKLQKLAEEKGKKILPPEVKLKIEEKIRENLAKQEAESAEVAASEISKPAPAITSEAG